MLNQEEIEEVDVVKMFYQDASISAIEKWCNTFAYFLLLGKEKAELLDKATVFNAQNDYGHAIVKQISKETNLSPSLTPIVVESRCYCTFEVLAMNSVSYKFLFF